MMFSTVETVRTGAHQRQRDAGELFQETCRRFAASEAFVDALQAGEGPAERDEGHGDEYAHPALPREG